MDFMPHLQQGSLPISRHGYLMRSRDLDYPDATGSRLASSFGEVSGNPYSTLYSGSFNKYNSSKLFTDIILDQKLDFITQGLSLKGKVSLSTYYKTLDLTASYGFPSYLLDYSKIGVDENGDGIVDQNPWSRNGQGNEVYTLPPLDINVGGLVSGEKDKGFYKDLYYEMSFNYARGFGDHPCFSYGVNEPSAKEHRNGFRLL